MNIRSIAIILLVLARGGWGHAAFSQDKLAQTGFNFLSVGTDARATGMGEAFTTVDGVSTSLFYNPAGIAGIESFVDLSTNQMTWLADIKYISGSLAFAPFDGEYGVLGISLMHVNYGEFKFTRFAPTESGYEDITDYPKPAAYMVGVGYARKLSTQFSIGGQVKFVRQDLGQSLIPVYTSTINDLGQLEKDTTLEKRDYAVSVFAFDFGTIYRTGWKSLAFGMSVNNFSREISYVRESFQLPLVFKFGVSMNFIDLIPELAEYHSLFISVDAVHPRSYPELLNFGGEYVFSNTVALRLGYTTHHPDFGLTAGFGVRKFGLAVDYSYTPHEIFNNIQRFSISFAL